MTEQENLVEQTNTERSNRHIGGWLLLYLVLSVVFDVAAIVLMLCGKLRSIVLPSANGQELSLFVFLILAASVMTVYVVLAFRNRKPDAVFLGRHHVIINAVPIACVMDWLLMHTDRNLFAVLSFVLFFGSLVVWRYYFNNSSLVKALIPPETCKFSSREKYLVSFLYLVIGVMFCIHSGFLDQWWKTIFIIWGLLSLSPLVDLPYDFGKDEKDEPDK